MVGRDVIWSHVHSRRVRTPGYQFFCERGSFRGGFRARFEGKLQKNRHETRFRTLAVLVEDVRAVKSATSSNNRVYLNGNRT